jgi:hypothetical protein
MELEHARPLPSEPKVYGLPQAVVETATSQSVVQLVTRGASSNHTGTTAAAATTKTAQNRRKLQEKLDAIFLETGKPYTGDLWELSDYVPQWMKGMYLCAIRNKCCAIQYHDPWNHPSYLPCLFGFQKNTLSGIGRNAGNGHSQHGKKDQKF